jgi:hypothetical protein
LDHPDGELRPILHSELEKKSMNILTDRRRGDAQPFRNFLITETFADKIEYLLFSRGEMRNALSIRRLRAKHFVPHSRTEAVNQNGPTIQRAVSRGKSDPESPQDFVRETLLRALRFVNRTICYKPIRLRLLVELTRPVGLPHVRLCNSRIARGACSGCWWLFGESE